MSSLKDNEYLKELETSFITNILNNETKILEMNSGILKINKLVVKLENKFKELFSKMKEYDLKKEKLKSNIRQNNINASRILNTWISVDEKFSLDNKMFILFCLSYNKTILGIFFNPFFRSVYKIFFTVH